MSAGSDAVGKHGNAYNIFILVLTLFSLMLMVLQLLPLSQALLDLLLVYDNAVCIIFLMDFAMNLLRAKPTRAYFIDERGWLDLIGSIPALGFFQATVLFRLARLSRLARITKLLRGQAGKDLVIDVLANRSQYATFITILLAGMVLSIASFVVLQVESGTADANITTGGRRALVGPRDDHHGRLRRLLPRHDDRASHRSVRHARGCRDHRRARKHPREPARLAVNPGRAGARRRPHDVGRASGGPNDRRDIGARRASPGDRGDPSIAQPRGG